MTKFYILVFDNLFCDIFLKGGIHGSAHVHESKNLFSDFL